MLLLLLTQEIDAFSPALMSYRPVSVYLRVFLSQLSAGRSGVNKFSLGDRGLPTSVRTVPPDIPTTDGDISLYTNQASVPLLRFRDIGSLSLFGLVFRSAFRSAESLRMYTRRPQGEIINIFSNVYYAPTRRVGGIKRCFCPSVCPSVCRVHSE